jgi:methylenetetrahydrofolate reductase (NADPH)
MLGRARHEIVPLRGIEEQFEELPAASLVAITASAKLGMDRTLEYTGMLAARGFAPSPHIAARDVQSARHLDETVARLLDAGVSDVFVVGGDGPPGPCYRSGIELAEAARGLLPPTVEIGVGGYPEGHPDIDRATLLDALVRKQQFATYLVTQICFDACRVVEWIGEIRSEGIHLPVHVGVPGVMNRRKLLEFSLKLGVGTSRRFLAKNRGFVGGLARPGRYDPGALIGDLAPALADPALGIDGLQVYTFNQVSGTMAWERRATA